MLKGKLIRGEESEKNFIQYFVRFLIRYLVLVGIGGILLIGAAAFPSNRIQENLKQSAEFMEIEGEYPYMGLKSPATALDNWTEAAILNFCYTMDNNKPVQSAFLLREYRSEEAGTGVEHFIQLLREKEWDDTDNLMVRPSYWIGYISILRPMLFFMDYYQCREVLYLVSIIFLFALCFYLSKNLDNGTAIGLGIILFIFNYYVLSMQYAMGIFCVFIAGGAIIYMVQKKGQIDYLLFFFTIGIVAAYFDWLSIPFVTLGVPMCIAVTLKNRKDPETKLVNYICMLFRAGFGWCLGYALMVLSKTGIAMLLLGSEAGEYFKDRLLADSTTISFRQWIESIMNLFKQVFPFNFGEISYNGILFIILFFILASVGGTYILKEKRSYIISLVLLFLFPCVWYFIVKGHLAHTGIEYRTLMISYFSGWMIVKEFFEYFKKKKETIES